MRSLGNLRIVPIIHDRVTSSSSYFDDPPAIEIPRGIVGSAIVVVSLTPLDPSYGETVLELKTGQGEELAGESTIATITASVDGEDFVGTRRRVEVPGDRLGTHIRLDGPIESGESYDLAIFLLLEETAPAGAPGGFASYAGGEPTPSVGGLQPDTVDFNSVTMFSGLVTFGDDPTPGPSVDLDDPGFAAFFAWQRYVNWVPVTRTKTSGSEEFPIQVTVGIEHSDDDGAEDPWSAVDGAQMSPYSFPVAYGSQGEQSLLRSLFKRYIRLVVTPFSGVEGDEIELSIQLTLMKDYEA